jgi:uncharacterized membrane protein
VTDLDRRRADLDRQRRHIEEAIVGFLICLLMTPGVVGVFALVCLALWGFP